MMIWKINKEKIVYKWLTVRLEIEAMTSSLKDSGRIYNLFESWQHCVLPKEHIYVFRKDFHNKHRFSTAWIM
jgi:hypothetical protein